MMNKTQECTTSLKKKKVAAYVLVKLNPINSMTVIAKGYEPSTTKRTKNIATTVMTLIVLNWLIVTLAKSRVEAEAPPTSIVSCASDGSELCRFTTRFRI